MATPNTNAQSFYSEGAVRQTVSELVQDAESYADSASDSAISASDDASSAATSETNAAASASAAATSETNALASASAAATSETNAASSASSAATSEANAATSETNAASSASNASTSATNAATSETNAASSASNAATSETNAAASESAAAISASNAATSETNAASSASAAATSETNAATSATNAATSETNAAASASSASDDASYAQEWANADEDTLVSVAAGGDGINDYSSMHWAMKSQESSTKNIPSRNSVINQEPLSQGEAQRVGFETVIGTNTPTVDTTSPGFGYFSWRKDRNNAENHYLFDGIRGDFYVSSNTTAAQVAGVPAATADDVTWTEQTIHEEVTVDNFGLPLTIHNNPYTGFALTDHDGNLETFHEIKHGLNVVDEIVSFWKGYDNIRGWVVTSSMFPDQHLRLNTTVALASGYGVNYFQDTAILKTDEPDYNDAGGTYIGMHYTSVPGVRKVGKYIGTGAAGNYVDCGFKASWVMVKNLSTGSWVMLDAARGLAEGVYLLANTSDAQVTGSGSNKILPTPDGFAVTSTNADCNGLNAEYLFIALAETAVTPGTRATTEYSYPTTADTITIENGSILSYANGYNAQGQVDTQETISSGTTVTLGAGYENGTYYIYKDKSGAFGITPYRPLEGYASRNDSDKWGEESPLDASTRTTARHFDYESSTGVVSASGETADYEAFEAFNKKGRIEAGDLWSVPSTTTSWLQYKQDEKRVLKSWRLRQGGDADAYPRRFTIEGSNDGLSWTAIDSTYSAADFTAPGVFLWSPLQDTSANSVAYAYHRINITANGGDPGATEIGELEFNTITPSDYYLVQEGKMYNSSDVAIERTYLGFVQTDADGDVIYLENFPVAKVKAGDAEFHKDVTVHGDIHNRGVTTAWVVFDGTQNPPLILDSYNVADVVDLGTGAFRVLFESGLDLGYTVNPSHTAPVNSGSAYYSEKARLSVDVVFLSGNTTPVVQDPSDASVVIHGGKEIK